MKKQANAIRDRIASFLSFELFVVRPFERALAARLQASGWPSEEVLP
jgi:hypothetical protein